LQRIPSKKTFIHYVRFILLILVCNSFKSFAQTPREDSAFIIKNYSKIERMIPMRDGVRLFSAIYIPKKSAGKSPFLMERTPYSCSPYGEKNIPWWGLGPTPLLLRENYIFVYQDVRGRYKSEGSFEEMTPAIDNKKSNHDTDESSDTYDTIVWLLKNISNNNGRVGIYGISYPGFYATASLPNAHPALRAVSPQAPVTDEFIGDDAYHNGAFFLLDNFDFTNYFQGTRIDSGTNYKEVFNTDYIDAYKFFLELGPIKNTNRKDLFDRKAKIWNEYLEHDVYDSYWKSRNIRSHLKNIKPATLLVGGWFDAEDMFGALRTYEAIEKQTPVNNNRIIIGPWTHGAWAGPNWSHFGSYDFGKNLNSFFAENEANFFNYYLKDQGKYDLAKATVYETGTDQWKSYSSWPPANVQPTHFYFDKASAEGTLMLSSYPSKLPENYSEWISDPSDPIPYSEGVYKGRNNEYLVEDQRFAGKRKDVVSFQTAPLLQDLTITGRPTADLFMSTSGSDMDVIVKIIDVLPADEPSPANNPKNLSMPGFQRLVRAEVFRGKFRNSYEKPEPFIPGQITKVHFDLNEIAHTFRKGHRLMVQVQSSWFPIVDRNPQTFVDIPNAERKDFQKSTIRLYSDKEHPSSILLPVMP